MKSATIRQKASLFFGDPLIEPNLFASIPLLWLAIDTVVRNSRASRGETDTDAGAEGRRGAFGPSMAAAFALTVYVCHGATGWLCPFFPEPVEISRGTLAGYLKEKKEKPGADKPGDGPDEFAITAAHLRDLTDRAGHDRIYIAGQYKPVMRSHRLPPYRSIPYYDPMETARHRTLYDALSPLPKDGVFRPRLFSYSDLDPAPHARFYDWAGVRLLVVPGGFTEAPPRDWTPAGQLDGDLPVFENPRVVPRASLWTSFHTATDAEALAELVAPAPIDRSAGVALEEAPDPAWLARRGAPSPSGEGRLEWVADAPELQRLIAEAPRPTLLVLSDSYAPGWSCTVDGRPARILRANYLFRAVAVPEGRHEVTFRYRPRGIEAGLALTLAGLAALGLGPRLARRPVATEAPA